DTCIVAETCPADALCAMPSSRAAEVSVSRWRIVIDLSKSEVDVYVDRIGISTGRGNVLPTRHSAADFDGHVGARRGEVRSRDAEQPSAGPRIVGLRVGACRGGADGGRLIQVIGQEIRRSVF